MSRINGVVRANNNPGRVNMQRPLDEIAIERLYYPPEHPRNENDLRATTNRQRKAKAKAKAAKAARKKARK